MLRIPVVILNKSPEYSGVYGILNKVTGKIYVGSSIHVGVRWTDHKSELNYNKHKNVHLQRAWNKYGKDAFVFFIIEYSEAEDLIQREQYWIDRLQAADPKYGYDINARADRITYTEVVRQKLSEKTKQYMNTSESKARLSKLAKQRQTLEQYMQTEEGKQHLYNLAHGEKTEKQLNAMLNWSRSPEGREHTRQLGLMNRVKKAKTVYQYTPELELVQTYYTPADVDTQALGCHNNSIARACRENQGRTNKKIFKGFIWSYETLTLLC